MTFPAARRERSGQAQLAAGSVVVADPATTANSIIVLSPIGVANVGALGVVKNPGVGFTILSGNVLDARACDYRISEA